jgi:hypothetical protein
VTLLKQKQQGGGNRVEDVQEVKEGRPLPARARRKEVACRNALC